ncbi:MAG TPA: acyl-CoA dehydrogenase family protein [Candidatus Dormibacteraeota bacterium]|jgi:acyl-CoA dehydrogenase|nr:acyl-CoA dehydrogenase family protein [Candidatus Dormibacteraeota bacterium]
MATTPATQAPAAAAPSFALTEDQAQLRDWVHDFAARVVRPAAEEWDEREETPWPIIQEAAKIGLYSFEFLHTTFGDETGLTMPIVNEELFWGDAGIGLSIFGSHLASAAIFANGTPEQMLEWIPRCFGTPDEVKLGAFAITEPNAGSDVASLRTRARRDGDDWIIDGTKCFITNGGIADVHVVVATVDPELGHGGHATFVIEKGAAGLSQGAKHKKLGIRASHTAEVVLENVRVPAANLLGGVEKLEHKMARARDRLTAARAQAANGSNAKAAVASAEVKGTSGALRTLELSRPTVGAQAVGIARAAYEYALDYATTREQFGRPIIANQAISFLLADMATEIEAARMLCWHAAWMGRNAQEFDKAQGSMAKLKAGEVANWVTDQAISICGGWGYVRELPVQRWHRDAKIYTLFEGTREIQRRVIARAISKGASELP